MRLVALCGRAWAAQPVLKPAAAARPRPDSLLAWRWRAGLVATAVLMVADVAINAYAWVILGFDAFAGAVPVQAGFAAVVLALAWRYRAGGPFTTG
jgi:hypothetical protein